MAPIGGTALDEINNIEDQIKDTIQSLYQLLVQVNTYDATPAARDRPTRDVLTAEVRTLSNSLQAIHRSALAAAPQQPGEPPADPHQARLPSVPSELVQYVEAGRNPDIYTREFVELVRRLNQLMRGKAAAFGSFRDVLAEQIRVALPELSSDVERIMSNKAGESSKSGAPAEQSRPGPSSSSSQAQASSSEAAASGTQG